jgi:alcohol dehydrogenase class IV
MRRVAGALLRAYVDGRDAQAREDMALGSLFGGMALANAKLGAVHGFAGALGGMFPAPHGMICARLLPLVMEANVQALKSRAPNSPALQRYTGAAQVLTGQSTATIGDVLAWLQALCADLAAPSLSHFGVNENAIPLIIAQAQRASSMKGNPIQLTEQELAGILRRAL